MKKLILLSVAMLVSASSFAVYKEVGSAAEFLKTAKSAKGGVTILKVSAGYCGACKMIQPEFERLAKQYPQVNFIKIDVSNDDGGLASGVKGLPTFFVYKNGKKTDGK